MEVRSSNLSVGGAKLSLINSSWSERIFKMLISVAGFGIADLRQESIRFKDLLGYKVSSVPAWGAYQDAVSKQTVK